MKITTYNKEGEIVNILDEENGYSNQTIIKLITEELEAQAEKNTLNIIKILVECGACGIAFDIFEKFPISIIENLIVNVIRQQPKKQPGGATGGGTCTNCSRQSKAHLN